ncbi:DUF6311 domain-containing protein [Pantoea sp. C2G6]|uniref:DUF6311 domain-containing protein n=1 Tax=Pantoea sp. C2G6 TaxID=3243084 RepID=UPI003ED98D98
MSKDIKDRVYILLSLLTGIITFLIFSDIAIIDPKNIAWLMKGDPAQHYLGWSTFRHTPLLQWPIGTNYNYGMAVSSSIVFTDSIPLIAIPLKYFNFLLPSEFQYTGIWLLLCYMLQSLFGYKILNHLTGNKVFSLVGGFILSFAPIFLLRTQGHYALSGQFLILAAFLLYLKPFSTKKWTTLLCITALVHAYLLMMVLLIFVAKTIISAVESKNYRNHIISFVTALLFCLFFMYAEGYFLVHNGLAAGGFGEYRADLLSLFNPSSPDFSRFTRVNNNQLQNGEGLGYIGFGVIICLSSLFILCAKKIEENKKSLTSTPIVVPVLIIIGCFLYSISNVVSLQGFEIFRFNLPHFLVGPVNTFRASGRFIWPISYLVIIMSIFSLWFLNKKYCLPLIFIIAIIQLYDISKFGDMSRSSIKNTAAAWNKNNINDYDVDYSKFQSVAMYPPRDFNDKSNIIYLAALHGLPVNAGYMARYDTVKDAEQNRKIDTLIEQQRLEKGIIYFIGESAKNLASLCGQGYICQDGFAGKMMYKQ